MPRRPPISGYARIAQAEEEEDSDTAVEPYSDAEDASDSHALLSSPADHHVSIQPGRKDRPRRQHGHTHAGSTASRRSSTFSRRQRTNSTVDIKAINARFEKWADEIKDTFKIRKVKGKTNAEEHLEIHHSVFNAPEWIRPVTEETTSQASDELAKDSISKLEFDDIVESVRVAIELGQHPKMITQGSSGSYFARNTSGKTVGVFKPKDEEPYASRNPKWTKWIHRNLFPFFFGRACLIPNLSYISEAAAYVLDCRLHTHMVPYTAVVALSSKSFYYDFWERKAYYRGKKPLPEKQGSFQVFLKGFKDANIFLKEHPWPDNTAQTAQIESNRRRWIAEGTLCAGSTTDDDHDGTDSPRPRSQAAQSFWTPQLQTSLREQLERLVILDYIMRNTDRGLDNWMIRIDQKEQTASVVAEPPQFNNYDRNDNDEHDNDNSHGQRTPGISIGAIDNSLSWPWKHPDAWRSYPFGWLFLPVSLIGRPFSAVTRHHFLPLLTSTHWWSETIVALRQCFEQDSDFSERMFARQIAVMKGQAWNVVETLKTDDHGPLELTRRARVCVWDDVVEIPVATPLRSPSAEMRQRREGQQTGGAQGSAEEHEEMDISAARQTAGVPHDRLMSLLDQSPGKSQKENRFNSSRQNSIDAQAAEDGKGPLSPRSINNFTADGRPSAEPGTERRRRSSSRQSTDRTRKLFDNFGRGPGRQASAGPSKRRHPSLSGGFDDELDGDLGYAAAEDQEGNQRKVIVERLETIKGKNPVFTWC